MKYSIARNLQFLGASAVGVEGGMTLAQMFGNWNAPLGLQVLQVWYLVGGMVLMAGGCNMESQVEETAREKLESIQAVLELSKE